MLPSPSATESLQSAHQLRNFLRSGWLRQNSIEKASIWLRSSMLGMRQTHCLPLNDECGNHIGALGFLRLACRASDTSGLGGMKRTTLPRRG